MAAKVPVLQLEYGLFVRDRGIPRFNGSGPSSGWDGIVAACSAIACRATGEGLGSFYPNLKFWLLGIRGSSTSGKPHYE